MMHTHTITVCPIDGPPHETELVTHDHEHGDEKHFHSRGDELWTVAR